MRSLLPILVGGSFLAAPAAHAWSSDPAVNTPICTVPGGQSQARGIPDGAGGAIFVWSDSRTDAGDIYAQRVGPDGSALWTADGVPVSTATGVQELPVVAPSGVGGAVVAWVDARSGDQDVYAQRLADDGSPVWTADGRPVHVAPGNQTQVCIAPDETGGCILLWTDVRTENGWPADDIWGQRIYGDGSPSWLAQGIVLGGGGAQSPAPRVLADGSGGAYVAWANTGCWDCMGGPDTAFEFHRLDAVSIEIWGYAPTGASKVTADMVRTADGVILAINKHWVTNFGADLNTMEIIRKDATGSNLWSSYIYYVEAGNDGPSMAPFAAPDGTDGIIVAAQNPTPYTDQLLAQHVTGDGAARWPAYHVVGPAGFHPRVIPDGGRGAIVTQSVEQDGSGVLLARHLDAKGRQDWPTTSPGGEPRGLVLASGYSTSLPYDVLPDGTGGVIVVWAQTRTGDSDIFAQRASARGILGGSTDDPRLARSQASWDSQREPRLRATPNPTSSTTRVSFSLEAPDHVRLDVYAVDGRRVATLANAPFAPGSHVVEWDGRDAQGRTVPAGVYFTRLVRASGGAVESATVVRTR